MGGPTRPFPKHICIFTGCVFRMFQTVFITGCFKLYSLQDVSSCIHYRMFQTVFITECLKLYSLLGFI